jgi:hypothetical protein
MRQRLGAKEEGRARQVVGVATFNFCCLGKIFSVSFERLCGFTDSNYKLFKLANEEAGDERAGVRASERDREQALHLWLREVEA